jgi:hypothetical protein
MEETGVYMCMLLMDYLHEKNINGCIFWRCDCRHVFPQVSFPESKQYISMQFGSVVQSTITFLDLKSSQMCI